MNPEKLAGLGAWQKAMNALMGCGTVAKIDEVAEQLGDDLDKLHLRELYIARRRDLEIAEKPRRVH
jgi:hypothetical protein